MGSLVAALATSSCGSPGVESTDGSGLTPVDGQFVECAGVMTLPYAPGTVVRSTDGNFGVDLLENHPGAADVNDPPATWVKGSNTWIVQVSDAAGQALSGLAIQAVPRMPEHNHGTSITPLTTDEGGGKYTISPLYLYMGGHWQITLTIRPPAPAAGADAGAALTSDTAVFDICIPG